LASIVSTTAWPETEYEVLCSVHALLVVLQLPPATVFEATGGPRAPTPPSALFGTVVLALELRGRPEHLAPPAHSSVADAADQLEAPGTLAAPELAAEPGEPAGGSAASFPAGFWSPPCPFPSPVCTEPVLAFSVDRAANSGLIEEASGPEEAPELVTPWQCPPDTPSQEPQLRSPLVVLVAGSLPLAELVTLPLHLPGPSQDMTPPVAVAAEGPEVSRLRVGFPDSVCAAPGPE
jgi:hypothetical protein